MGLREEGRKALEVSATGRCRVGTQGWKEVEDFLTHLGALSSLGSTVLT